MISSIVFYLFAGLLIFGCLGLTIVKNPVYSVLFLIFSFFNVAVLFVILKSEFLAMILIMTYVGALTVLLLFTLMLVNIKIAEKRKYYSKYLIMLLGLFVIFILELYFVFSHGILSLSNASANSIVDISSVSSLGLVLFDKYYYVFLISGLVLFIAVLGAVVLSSAYISSGNKTQSITEQNSRDAQNSVFVVKVNKEEGTK